MADENSSARSAPLPPGIFRVAPSSRETTSSLICRIAARYGLKAKDLRSCWQWRNYPPGQDGGGARADAEVLLNAAGARKGGLRIPGLGRSRGSLTSKIHLACDAVGRPLAFAVTGGNTNDCTSSPP